MTELRGSFNSCFGVFCFPIFHQLFLLQANLIFGACSQGGSESFKVNWCKKIKYL